MAKTPIHLKLQGIPVITLHVGPDKTLFQVHQDLLFDASPVFKAAFFGNFQEASERSMPLPDDDEDSVGRMISWLYTKQIELTVPVSDETSEECYMQLAELNTLADKYDICLLKNKIVDEIFGLRNGPNSKRVPQLPMVKYVYDNTTTGSSFRKLMVAWYAFGINLKWYDNEGTKTLLAETPQEFTIDLVMELGARQAHLDRSSPFKLPASVFYETPPKKIDEEKASQASK
ncbi:hypothetical protein BDR22DRAFT_337189 [Usnea florida]